MYALPQKYFICTCFELLELRFGRNVRETEGGKNSNFFRQKHSEIQKQNEMCTGHLDLWTTSGHFTLVEVHFAFTCLKEMHMCLLFHNERLKDTFVHVLSQMSCL